MLASPLSVHRKSSRVVYNNFLKRRADRSRELSCTSYVLFSALKAYETVACNFLHLIEVLNNLSFQRPRLFLLLKKIPEPSNPYFLYIKNLRILKCITKEKERIPLVPCCRDVKCGSTFMMNYSKFVLSLHRNEEEVDYS